MNKKFRWSFSWIFHQLSFDVAKKEKRKNPRVSNLGNRGMSCLFHPIETDVIPRHFRGVWPSIIRLHPQFVRPHFLRPPPPI
jgi:hypothetical protein